MARMVVADPEYVTTKYSLRKLEGLEDFPAEAVNIHAKVTLNNPSTYEIIDPADFGMTRYVHFASCLRGWNAVKTRIGQLGLSMMDDQVKVVTQKVKALADVRPIAIDDADSIIRTFHLGLAEATEEAPEASKAGL
ncbi:hypothetical protein B0T25DRAFT_564486 [Lasiosphaeria hispida]|uniref:2-isopropylmalate synthase/homocitrate synthase post-catalytic domain-containing protein n=1 Tax=Lasiosphaeria hispida TaxID=260671 RepID=A0AAJ0HQC6_9PEZI|nr:hypothetical protein B0T25DRAFT_564486 [Lasiosphaeria hispida]